MPQLLRLYIICVGFVVLLFNAREVLSDHDFCSSHKDKGGCLVIKDGEIAFADPFYGNPAWRGGGKMAKLSKTLRDKDKPSQYVKYYITVDEEGKRLYLSKTLEPGSYWEYEGARRRGSITTTIKTANPIKGGPYYIVPDFNNPVKRTGPKPGLQGTMEYIVYPAIVTTRKDDPGVVMTSGFISP